MNNIHSTSAIEWTLPMSAMTAYELPYYDSNCYFVSSVLCIHCLIVSCGVRWFKVLRVYSGLLSERSGSIYIIGAYFEIALPLGPPNKLSYRLSTKTVYCR